MIRWFPTGFLPRLPLTFRTCRKHLSQVEEESVSHCVFKVLQVNSTLKQGPCLTHKRPEVKMNPLRLNLCFCYSIITRRS